MCFFPYSQGLNVMEENRFSCKHTHANLAQPALTSVLRPQHKRISPSFSHPTLHNFLAHSCLPQEQPVSGWINCPQRKKLPVQWLAWLYNTTSCPKGEKKRTQGKKREKKERWGGEGGRRVCDKEEVEMVWQGESEKEKRKKEDGVEKVLGPHHQWIITRLIVRQRN